jgi:transposase
LGHAPLWQQPSGDSVLDPFVDFLTRRWNEGCRNAAQLCRELVLPGFGGRPSTVRHWLGKHRRRAPEQERLPAASRPPVRRAPRGCPLARLLMADTATLNAEDDVFETRLLADEPELNATIAWAQQFSALLRRKMAEDLDQILTAADGTMLPCFAAGLRRDFEAVNAALKLRGPPVPSKAGSATSRC